MMAPMLATPPSAYDLDAVPPFFFLGNDEEEFYPPPHSQLLPGPGEDIWRKFQLLPTPPLSPSRTPPPSDPSAADHLEAPSEPLDEERGPSAAFLQSFIIQDCMWSSSFAAATRLERAVSERLADLRARQNPPGPQVNPEDLQDLQAADCVDPSEVFPCAQTREERHETDVATTEGGSEAEPRLETPPLSGSSSSESEEESEEEEVDVVTVEQRRPAASPLLLKRAHIDIDQHNYAAPRPSGKRQKTTATAKQRGVRRCWSPRSDVDDEDRRRNHNVLERRRRGELKASFLALREQLPLLAHNAKAPKVLILKTAAEFVRRVGADERRLLRRKEELMGRKWELRRRLEELRTPR